MEEFIKRYKPVFGPKVNSTLTQEMTLKEKCESIINEAKKDNNISAETY